MKGFPAPPRPIAYAAFGADGESDEEDALLAGPKVDPHQMVDSSVGQLASNRAPDDLRSQVKTTTPNDAESSNAPEPVDGVRARRSLALDSQVNDGTRHGNEDDEMEEGGEDSAPKGKRGGKKIKRISLWENAYVAVDTMYTRVLGLWHLR